MNPYRAAALAAAGCVAALSLAACQGGLTSSSTPPATSAPAATSGPAATSAPAAGAPSASAPSGTSATGSSGSGSTISVNAPIGTFPIPPGASVAANDTENDKVEIVLTGVTAQEVSTFYNSALPSAGYTITSSDTATGTTFTGASTIKFTGHGYTGDIGALSGETGVNIPGITGLSGNDVGITLTPQ